MNNTKTKTAILSISFIGMMNTITSTILAQVAQSFPDASITAIQMLMTFGMIGSFPLTLISGGLATRFRKKPIILTALAAMIIGGIIPCFLHNKLVYLYISSILVGAGQGALMTMVSTISIELFEGDERSSMFGLETAVGNAGSVILLLLAGMLAKSSWVNIYFLYILVIPSFIFVLMWLPKGDAPASKESKSDNSKTPVPGGVMIVALLMVLFFIGFASLALNISMHLAEQKLGGPATTGVVMSIVTGGAIVGGLLFKTLNNTLKSYCIAFATACVALGLFLTYMSQSITLVFVAAAIFGVGFGISLPSGSMAITKIAKPERIPTSMGFYMSSTTVGAVASPFVINMFASALGGTDGKTVFLASAYFMIGVFILTVLWGTAKKKVFEQNSIEM